MTARGLSWGLMVALALLWPALLWPALLWPRLGWAQPPTLTLVIGGRTMEFTAANLLSRADARDITIPRDPSYGAPARYRAIPLLALLADLPADGLDTPEMRQPTASSRKFGQRSLAGVRRADQSRGSPSKTPPVPGRTLPARMSQPVRSISFGSSPSFPASARSSGRMPWRRLRASHRRCNVGRNLHLQRRSARTAWRGGDKRCS
jgi:hypothetical protein